MLIISLSFDYPNGGERYSSLARVFSYSIKRNCPKAIHKHISILYPKDEKNPEKWMLSNTEKLNIWVDEIESINDDIILMDCDMIVLSDLSVAFESDFDIGYTSRTYGNIPFNGGVIFVKNTEAAKKFCRRLKDVNLKMFKDEKFHRYWREKYVGMNQAAFGYLFEKERDIAKLKEFPCRIWNSCNEDWGHFNRTTKVVHIKSELRKHVLSVFPASRYGKKYEELIKVWRKLSVESLLEKPLEGSSTLKVFKYNSYQEYAEIQRVNSEKDFKKDWNLNREYLNVVTTFLSGRSPKFGICHGSKTGAEQKYFKENIRKCSIMGTEIASFASSMESTIQWDFNTLYPLWEGKADFIYSNSLSHSFNPEETLKVWVKYLSQKGCLILECSEEIGDGKISSSFPFKYTESVLINLIKECLGNEFTISNILEYQNKENKKDWKRFVVIERSIEVGIKRWEALIKYAGTLILSKERIQMVEVGVWRGRMSKEMLTRCNNLFLYMVDTWKRPKPGDSYYLSESLISKKLQSEFDDAYNACLSLEKGFKGRVSLIKSTSEVAASQFEDVSLDIVFIDGDHSYSGVKKDILSWRSKVKKGGILCGHDYDNPPSEVKKAVDELIPKGVVLSTDHTWFYTV